jgi:hypothetical protein
VSDITFRMVGSLRNGHVSNEGDGALDKRVLFATKLAFSHVSNEGDGGARALFATKLAFTVYVMNKKIRFSNPSRRTLDER